LVARSHAVAKGESPLPIERCVNGCDPANTSSGPERFPLTARVRRRTNVCCKRPVVRSLLACRLWS